MGITTGGGGYVAYYNAEVTKRESYPLRMSFFMS
jgi:hypothetical protein